MISLYTVMLVLLGFLLAALLLLIVLPAYRRRIERFAVESVKRKLPLTEAEILADRDRLKAQYALNVHRLEMQVEEAALAAAKQSVEINRREARIHDLEQEIAAHQTSFEEHENARRVLEQAILDRLPKVEQRLAEARKLLTQRDKEIALLTESSTAQTAALEEATQINIQQTDELHRLRAALDTRAARNRETLGDPRFDGEVALRTEIEMLRAKTREQAAMIERLQTGESGFATADDVAIEEIARLTKELARVETQLVVLKGSEGTAEAGRKSLEAKVRALESTSGDQAAEIARLKAALKTYEETKSERASSRDADAIAAKARISSLEAEAEEQRRVIQALRAEVAGSNEKLARQSQHFRDELRRLGGGAAVPANDARIRESDAKRQSLAERISAPRPPPLTKVAVPAETSPAANEQRGFLKALNGGADGGKREEAGAAGEPAEKPTPQTPPELPQRRPRLLERISGTEK